MSCKDLFAIISADFIHKQQQQIIKHAVSTGRMSLEFYLLKPSGICLFLNFISIYIVFTLQGNTDQTSQKKYVSYPSRDFTHSDIVSCPGHQQMAAAFLPCFSEGSPLRHWPEIWSAIRKNSLRVSWKGLCLVFFNKLIFQGIDLGAGIS